MRRLLAATPLLALLVALAGCPRAPVGVENVELPADSAATCQAQCGKVGLRMQSLVIMANYVGCVCAPADDVERPSASAGAAGGGLAAIMVLQQQQPPSSSACRGLAAAATAGRPVVAVRARMNKSVEDRGRAPGWQGARSGAQV
jgi:hypothetical protein